MARELDRHSYTLGMRSWLFPARSRSMRSCSHSGVPNLYEQSTGETANAGTFSMTASPSAAVSFAAGDRLEWEAPATADSAQADIYITIKATRTGS